nr:MAG TPA: hypothetical protein [Caudoviricetes sp.]
MHRRHRLHRLKFHHSMRLFLHRHTVSQPIRQIRGSWYLALSRRLRLHLAQDFHLPHWCHLWQMHLRQSHHFLHPTLSHRCDTVSGRLVLRLPLSFQTLYYRQTAHSLCREMSRRLRLPRQ